MSDEGKADLDDIWFVLRQIQRIAEAVKPQDIDAKQHRTEAVIALVRELYIHGGIYDGASSISVSKGYLKCAEQFFKAADEYRKSQGGGDE